MSRFHDLRGELWHLADSVESRDMSLPLASGWLAALGSALLMGFPYTVWHALVCLGVFIAVVSFLQRFNVFVGKTKEKQLKMLIVENKDDVNYVLQGDPYLHDVLRGLEVLPYQK